MPGMTESPATVEATRMTWRLAEPRLESAVHEHRLISQLLLQRGFTDVATAAAFLDPPVSAMPDPYALPRMNEAVERVRLALAQGKRIGIFGDYDVDGITSAAILLLALREAQSESQRVIVRLPHRFEGYGLSYAAIDELAAYGVTLLIAVDCGSSDHDQVAYAQSLGLDVLVLDHHHMRDEGPPGAIVVSAFQADGLPYREFSAAGLSWLLVDALHRAGAPVLNPAELIDLATLGALADMSNVTGAHRPLLRRGLRWMRMGKRPGLMALARLANVDLRQLETSDQVSKLTPRLNSAGRLGDPQIALDLLLASDPITANGLAASIELLNTERRAISQAIVTEAAEIVISRGNAEDLAAIVVSQRNWSLGVLGVAASQLVQQFNRPVVLLGEQGDIARGSARSVEGINLIAALEQCEELLERLGGHSQAAGLSVRVENLAAFTDALNRILALEPPREVTAVLPLDGTIDGDKLDLKLAHMLLQFEPHGSGNEQPLLLISRMKITDSRIVGKDQRHLSLTFQNGFSPAKGIFFSAADRIAECRPGTVIDVAGYVGVDRWNGREQVNIEIQDLRPA